MFKNVFSTTIDNPTDPRVGLAYRVLPNRAAVLTAFAQAKVKIPSEIDNFFGRTGECTKAGDKKLTLRFEDSGGEFKFPWDAVQQVDGLEAEKSRRLIAAADQTVEVQSVSSSHKFTVQLGDGTELQYPPSCLEFPHIQHRQLTFEPACPVPVDTRLSSPGSPLSLTLSPVQHGPEGSPLVQPPPEGSPMAQHRPEGSRVAQHCPEGSPMAQRRFEEPFNSPPFNDGQQAVPLGDDFQVGIPLSTEPSVEASTPDRTFISTIPEIQIGFPPRAIPSAPPVFTTSTQPPSLSSSYPLFVSSTSANSDTAFALPPGFTYSGTCPARAEAILGLPHGVRGVFGHGIYFTVDLKVEDRPEPEDDQGGHCDARCQTLL
jgi:hypothetical protein